MTQRDTEVQLTRYRTERAVLPLTGRSVWLVLDDETLEIMPEARDFALHLNGAGKSENTIRTYLPRVAVFLNWADTSPGCDWRTVTVKQLARFKWHLEARPALVEAATIGGRGERSTRSAGTVNQYLTAVFEFLRYCGRAGLIDQAVSKRLVEPRHLRHMPASFDAGERGQFRFARVKELRARETSRPPETLTAAQVGHTISAAIRIRDAFLLLLLSETGMRIGEALGLRRSDMHFLPDSTTLGCELAGAHVHVVRREDNANGALAKSSHGRHVPVGGEVVRAYRDAQIERESVAHATDSDYVFVNLWAGEIGAPMKYSAAYGLVQRAGRRADVNHLHPHLFRHTAATHWIENDTPIDVAQTLLGHASPASTSRYTHTSNERMRAAVERGAATVKVVE
ncbi:tyrosine-type recombinase/integrase [Plantibacter sp. CFBP 8775]|uniref:tyrosine-type recombinase/integrase n=1 Tax=Plantibacter sp. CFBP 8775 TaxID=2774038 RepID=UPI001783C72F|nr:tyrosine-type recombinase/integrase [Plantibacter sp. CFBP 8775]MBD8103975.1 tyrosine-type recombinase/integrase [Plantibacter sp. CFBP 8775]